MRNLGAIRTTLVLLVALLAVAFGCTQSTEDSIESPWDSSCAPIESPWPHGHDGPLTPPAGFLATVGWLQALDDTGVSGQSLVEVDWMRLHAVVNGVDRVLAVEEFDRVTTNMTYYGLYRRNPWFAGDKIGSMPYTLSSGAMVIEPSARPDMVYHWWTDRALVPSGTTRVWFEARIRITGGAHVQGGIDYWRDLNVGWAGTNVNNTEGGVSEWECQPGQWLTISVAQP